MVMNKIAEFIKDGFEKGKGKAVFNDFPNIFIRDSVSRFSHLGRDL